MADLKQLDRTYSFITRYMVENGRAPFHTEIAAELGLSPVEGRQALHDLMEAGVPAWLFPNTDYISSFSPFSSLPTQYRITVGGEQKWYGQWGFESLAVSWLFKGKEVKIEAPCLDCGAPVRIDMQDGKIKRTDPEGLAAYTSVPFSEWFQDLPYSWSTMNLFRSKEHVQKWSGYRKGTVEGILELPKVLELFSGDLFTRRLDPDYVSHYQEYIGKFVAAVSGTGKRFWAAGPT